MERAKPKIPNQRMKNTVAYFALAALIGIAFMAPWSAILKPGCGALDGDNLLVRVKALVEQIEADKLAKSPGVLNGL